MHSSINQKHTIETNKHNKQTLYTIKNTHTLLLKFLFNRNHQSQSSHYITFDNYNCTTNTSSYTLSKNKRVCFLFLFFIILAFFLKLFYFHFARTIILISSINNYYISYTRLHTYYIYSQY